MLYAAAKESGIILDRARLAVRLTIERPAASMLAMSGLSLAKWNDKPERTAGAVAAKLRAGAGKLRLHIERTQRHIAEIEQTCGWSPASPRTAGHGGRLVIRLDRDAPSWVHGILEDLDTGYTGREAVENAVNVLTEQADA